jgi:hypothetical protein
LLGREGEKVGRETDRESKIPIVSIPEIYLMDEV